MKLNNFQSIYFIVYGILLKEFIWVYKKKNKHFYLIKNNYWIILLSQILICENHSRSWVIIVIYIKNTIFISLI